MTEAKPSISVCVDVSNPGQFFACCGLFELADRLWPGGEAWFDSSEFCIACAGTLEELLRATVEAELEQLDAEDSTASPIQVPAPFDLRLDWWKDTRSGGIELKVWAGGSMDGVRIARAMQKAMAGVNDQRGLFGHHAVVYEPQLKNRKKKKVEPYCFDSRRGGNARSLDIGFAPDPLKMTTAACPAVEFLCLVGLQRFRPAPTSRRRIFDYYTWHDPLPLPVAVMAVAGRLENARSDAFRFENAFRTDQKKHKSFQQATKLEPNYERHSE